MQYNTIEALKLRNKLIATSHSYAEALGESIQVYVHLVHPLLEFLGYPLSDIKKVRLSQPDNIIMMRYLDEGVGFRLKIYPSGKVIEPDKENSIHYGVDNRYKYMIKTNGIQYHFTTTSSNIASNNAIIDLKGMEERSLLGALELFREENYKKNADILSRELLQIKLESDTEKILNAIMNGLITNELLQCLTSYAGVSGDLPETTSRHIIKNMVEKVVEARINGISQTPTN